MNALKEIGVSHCHWALAICTFAVFSVGCGSSEAKLYPVSGTVTFEGKPVEGASLLFVPQQGRPSMGTTDASGKYTISTNGNPGAPTGTYSVTVAKQAGAGSAGATAEMPSDSEHVSEEEMAKMASNLAGRMQAASKEKSKAKPAIPEKYAIPEGSGLSAKVTEDGSKNVFDFELTP